MHEDEDEKVSERAREIAQFLRDLGVNDGTVAEFEAAHPLNRNERY